jgi:HSP90 family molecular chaperone
MGPFMEALQMNKHIELIKKWLDKPESVSLEELEASREAAWADWGAAFDCAVEAAVYWAAEAATAAEDAAYWAAVGAADAAVEAVYRRNQTIKYIKEYEELTQ